MNKPILCLDFDGVIHSYTSGWKGAAVIPDPPVPGALEFIVKALDHFEVHIFSSRSHQWGGKRAMKRWLHQHLVDLAATFETTPPWLLRHIHTFADPWPDEVDFHINKLVGQIKWPWFKPPATVTLDDRAITFDGTWPDFDGLRAFKPWNKKRAPIATQPTDPTN